MFIKPFISAIAVVALAISAKAQTTEMNINGLTVILKPSEKQTVSAAMFFKGGTFNYSAAQQGIESLTLSATGECGTKKYDKDKFKDIADQYGINISGGSGYDLGYITMNCVKPYFNEGWDLFAEAINAPVFDDKELDLLKQKLIANLRQSEGDPDSKLSEMSLSNTFKNTRFAIRPSGTPESLEKLRVEDVKKYYQDVLFNKERMYLVVVGNISADELKAKVEKAFGKLPAKTSGKPVAQAGCNDLKISKNNFNSEERQLATNYIMGILGSPKTTSKEFNAYRLAFDILSDKLFEEVRTKRNLSYAPAAYVRAGQQPYAIIYVTTTKPKEAVTVMVDEIKRLSNGGFTATELRDAKSQFATAYFMKNESNMAMAMALGIAHMKGSWKDEETFLDKINAVTLPEMQSTFTQYANGIDWNYLGLAEQVDKAAFAKTVK